MAGSELRVGLIGLDMSHATEFTRRLNVPADPEHVPGARVVLGWPGGSKDFELSWSRVERFTNQVSSGRRIHGTRAGKSRRIRRNFIAIFMAHFGMARR
jgi:hypothetical protein